MDWSALLTALAVAIVSGVVSGLIAYGGISTKLDWHRKDINEASASAKEAKELALQALLTANKALLIAERRGES